MKTNKFYHWLLAISATVLLFNSTQLLAQTCTPPPAGMVAWFPGDGNANDIQGSNNGTVSNSGVTFTAGKVAQAFNFDGTGDVTYSTINAGSAYTVDFWVRPSSSGPTNSRQEVIGNNFQDAQSFGQITFTNTQIEYFQGGGIRVLSALGSVPFDTYTHITLTYDGSVNRLYINGNLVSTSNVHTETFNNPIKLGNSVLQVGNARFNGRLDEVEIFNRALSQTEIQAIVTADSAGKCKSPITFIVNTTGDTNDGACSQTHCSLREAIIASNASAGVKDIINFNIPGGGVQTISIGSSGLGGLPPITDAVDINGYSQPGSVVNTATDGSTNAVLLVELNGQFVNTNLGSLVLSEGSSGSTIRGLVINRFANGAGININTSNIFVGGCFIGTDATGTAALPNDDGVFISPIGSNNGTRIGSAAPQDRNLISGNNTSGIELNNGGVTNSTLTDTEVSGNLIGTNVLGTAAIPNENGVAFIRSGNFPGNISNVRIGIPVQGGGNIISGNRSDGIRITTNFPLTELSIRNNRIGTNALGTAAVSNGSNPTDSTISGRSGIYSFGFGVNNVQIGGVNANEGNLISGNFNHGIYLRGPNDNNIIQGNRIGTDASGTATIGNTIGVNIESSRNNIVGGTTTGARNLISGNNNDGVSITGSRSTGNVVQSNFIGTDISGTANLGNVDMGVFIGESALNNVIGDAAGNAGNLIAFNGGSGVFVAADSSRNSILANSIFSNTGLGIDLFPAGVTPNDAGDGDTGANNLQNYPVLTSAITSNNATTVSGTFNSTPNTQFRIEFFFSPACDPTGLGEGKFFIGSKSITTDASGNSTVNFNPAFTVETGQFITSTATDPNGNTSEFSACSVVTLTPTAAPVSISGRVLTNNGRGIRNVMITLTDSRGNERTAQTTAFGYYRFDNAAAGETVTLSAKARRFRFIQSSIVRTTNESITNADFISVD